KKVSEYVELLCDVFGGVNLQPRGSVWVNIGDKRQGGLSLIPERFAIAMTDRGWRLMDSVIWAKVYDNDDGTTEGNCMIEPALRRLNGNGWEPFYRFVKSVHPYCDHCAVRIPRNQQMGEHQASKRYMPKTLMEVETATDGRVAHNVWKVG